MSVLSLSSVCIHYRTLVDGTVVATVKACLFILINLFQIIQHRQGQRLVFWVILDPIELAIFTTREFRRIGSPNCT